MYTHVELSKFWGSDIQSYNVAWGDFNTDGIMRLVAVGESGMRGVSLNERGKHDPS